jgi:hypothetical protein
MKQLSSYVPDRTRLLALLMCGTAIGAGLSLYRMIRPTHVYADCNGCVSGGACYPVGYCLGRPGNGSTCGSDDTWHSDCS